MLNPFPQLLSFGFFVPTLLRVTAAVALAYSAYYILQNRKVVSHSSLPIIGKPHVALVWVSSSITTLVAAALLFGYGTQIAALLGAFVSFKYMPIPTRLENLSPLSRSTYLVLGIICLSLIVTGAGAFAMDIRL